MTVDELVVELRLDPANFTKGQRDALDSFKKTNDEFEKGLKDLDGAAKKTGFSFGGMTAAAEGLFTVLAGAGMAAYARNTMNSVAATGRLAHNIGEATGEVSAFGRMIERNGGSADAAMGSLKGFSDQITRLNTLGQGSPELFNFLGTIGGEAGEGPLATFMKFAEWAENHKDNPQLVSLVGTQGGFDQGAINEAMKGRVQVLKDFEEASRGAVGPEQVKALTALQKSWLTLDQSVEKTGRDVVTNYAPGITSAMEATSQWVEHNQKLADSLGTVLTAIVGLSALKPALWILRLLGLTNPYVAAAVASAGAAAAITGYVMPADKAKSWNEAYPTLGKIDSFFGLGGDSGDGGTGPTAGGAFKSQAEKEAFIRATAIKAGIDPNIAMSVARSEGFNSFLGDNGTSGGAFQLHVTPGGRGHAVGDEFQKLTGLNPLDPANEHESIMFGLEWAKRHGWHDFHGAANSGIGDHQGIGDVTINVTSDSKDPREHGRVAAEAFKKRVSSNIATQANTGLN
jgi:hypothetical protein